MSSPSFPFRESPVRDRLHSQSALNFSGSIAWANGLGSMAVVAGLLGLRWTRHLTQQLGDSSEAIFRGDRLPLLPAFPCAPRPTPQDSTSGSSCTDAASTIL